MSEINKAVSRLEILCERNGIFGPTIADMVHTVHPSASSESIHGLLKQAMHYSPNRIIIGNDYDGNTALTTLISWNT